MPLNGGVRWWFDSTWARGLYHAKQNPSSKEYLMLLFDFLQNNTTKMAVVFIIYN
jgi:hypothetical protein